MNTFITFYKRLAEDKSKEENLGVLTEALLTMGRVYKLYDEGDSLLGQTPEGEWKVLRLSWIEGQPILSVRLLRKDLTYMDSYGECRVGGREFDTPAEGAFEVFCELV